MGISVTIRRLLGEIVFRQHIDNIIRRIESFLKLDDSLLDLGCGSCLFTKIFREKGYTVTPVDVVNKSYYPDITPQIYDGECLPFPDNHFDVCLLIAVLHHTSNPVKIFREAVRVSKKLVVSEDIYTNTPQKHVTYIIDSLLNREFFNHPHSNKDDKIWKEIFRNLGLKLIRTEYSRSWVFLSHATYYLTKTDL